MRIFFCVALLVSTSASVFAQTTADVTFATYLGGSGNEFVTGIVTDAEGHLIVSGTTTSADLPGASGTSYGGNTDAFVSKIDPSAGTLIFTVYVGGSGQEQYGDVAVAQDGTIYLTGSTFSTDLPTTAGALQAAAGGGGDGFVAQLSSNGQILGLTYLGGSGADDIFACDILSDGSVVVTGGTHSAGFPTSSGAHRETGGGPSGDAFVTALAPTLGTLAFSSLLGGSDYDQARDIDISGDGSLVIVGQTTSTDFPVTGGAAQSVLGGNTDVFVARMSADASSVTYGTYWGGGTDHWERPEGLAIGGDGNLYVIGNTDGTDFPTVDGFQNANAGGFEGFYLELAPSGSDYTMSVASYVGGAGYDNFLSIAASANGSGCFGGYTDGLTLGDGTVVSGPAAALCVTETSGKQLIHHSVNEKWDMEQNGLLADIGEMLFGDAAFFVAGNTETGRIETVNPVQSAPAGGFDVFMVAMQEEAAQNTPPTISDIADQTIAEDGTAGPVEFTVEDAETPASELVVTATSSNQTLLPDANIFIGGSGANRTMTVVPAQNASGTATITVTVTDASGLTATGSFTLTVTPVNDADLAVRLDVPSDPPVAGEPFTFTVKTSNAGPEATKKVETVITLPPTWVSAIVEPGEEGTSCEVADNVVTCECEGIPLDAECSEGITVDVPEDDAGKTVTVTGSVKHRDGAEDSDDSNDFVEVLLTVQELKAQKLKVTKKLDDLEPFRILKFDDGFRGLVVGFQISVENPGPEPAKNVIVQDHLPDGYEFYLQAVADGLYCGKDHDPANPQADDIVSCVMGDIPPGATWSIFPRFRVGPYGMHTNLAIAKSDNLADAQASLDFVATALAGRACLSGSSGGKTGARNKVACDADSEGVDDVEIILENTATGETTTVAAHAIDFDESGTVDASEQGFFLIGEAGFGAFTLRARAPDGFNLIEPEEAFTINIAQGEPFTWHDFLFARDDNVPTASISGGVFDDVNWGGGGEGRAGGELRDGAIVELYDGNGALVRTTTTSDQAGYLFSDLPADSYVVRVVNSSVTPARAKNENAGNLIPVQTYRTDASSGAPQPVKNRVGGEVPSKVDAPANPGGISLAALSTNDVTPQSMTTVLLQGEPVGGVDFVFNFDTIVNTNSSGQGSLHQFIVNSNGLSNAGLAQEGHPAGDETSLFVIPPSDDPLGRPADPGYTGGRFVIMQNPALPTVTDKVILNGRTQTDYSGDTHVSPEIFVDGSSGGGDGLTVAVPRIDVSGVTLSAFPGNGIFSPSDLEVKNVGPDGDVEIVGNEKDGIAASSLLLSGREIYVAENKMHGVRAEGNATVEQSVTSDKNGKWGVYAGGNVVIGLEGADHSSVFFNEKGGIFAGGSRVDLANVTVDANGHGAASSPEGNGIHAEDAAVEMLNVSVTGNRHDGIRAASVEIDDGESAIVMSNGGHGIYSRGNVTATDELKVDLNGGWGIVTHTGNVTVGEQGSDHVSIFGNGRDGVNAGGSKVVLNNATVSANGLRNGGSGIVAASGSVSMLEFDVSRNLGDGIRAQSAELEQGILYGNKGRAVVVGGSLTALSVHVSANEGDGIAVSGQLASGKLGGTSTITNATITGNGGNGLFVEANEDLTVRASNIAGNTGLAIRNAGAAGVATEDVWWGRADGPASGDVAGQVSITTPRSEPVVVNDADKDGIPDAIEASAPNAGDGNRDGIQDSAQPDVASFATTSDSVYATLVLTEGVALGTVIVRANPSPGTASQGTSFPLGFVAVALDVGSPGGTAAVSLHHPESLALTDVLQYGPTTAGGEPGWYAFGSDGPTGAELQAGRIMLHFVDGGRGDNDHQADGYITALIAPVTAQALARVLVLPSDVVLGYGAEQQFRAEGLDQFGGTMQIAPSWNATGGIIDAGGLFRAGDTAGYFIVSAEDGGVRGEARIEIVSGVASEDDVQLPSAFALHQAYPNPFNPKAIIPFDIHEAAHVELVVYDVLGHAIAVLRDAQLPAGRYEATFEADELPSGLYLYRIRAGRFHATKTMLLVK